MSTLRQQMDDAMVLRGLSARTRESYLACVSGLAKYYGRSPEQIDAAQVQGYLLHLITERKLAYASVNQAACACRFFYGKVLGQTARAFEIPMAKTPKRLPQVLSREEVQRLFDHSPNLRARTLLMCTYAAGLRLSEVCNLRLSDIESAPDRMCIKVRQGKGGKDRYTLLSPLLLVGIDTHEVAFRVRANNEGDGKRRTVRLEGGEFIRRFLLHVLPPGFKRIRHYGLLAPAHKRERLSAARAALRQPEPDPVVVESLAQFMQRIAHFDIQRCPCCGHVGLRVTPLPPAKRISPPATRGPP